MLFVPVIVVVPLFTLWRGQPTFVAGQPASERNGLVRTASRMDWRPRGRLSRAALRDLLVFLTSMTVIFLLAMVPVVQMLPGQLLVTHTTSGRLLADLSSRLADGYTLGDLFSPYIYLGV